MSGNLTFYLGKQATNTHKNKDIIGWVIRIMEKVRHYGNSWLLRGQTRKLRPCGVQAEIKGDYQSHKVTHAQGPDDWSHCAAD